MLSHPLLALALAAAMLAPVAHATTPPRNPGAIRNVVLVHGVFADGSSWAAVIANLQARGLHVTAVQNPLTSLAADVAATKSVLAMQDGPTVLVGHSYGGKVIRQAGDDSKVAALVYIAALAPEAGEDFGQLAERFPAPPGQASIRVTDGYAQLDEAGFIANFAPDASTVTAHVLASVQAPVAAGLFGEHTTVAAWKSKPSWYAVSTDDRMLAPAMERFLAERMHAATVELDSGHASPITVPGSLADLIVRATEGGR